MKLLKRIGLVWMMFLMHHVQAQQIGLQLPADSTRISFRFEQMNNLVIVKLGINGKAHLPFILDTSVEFTTLTSKAVADELGFNYVRQMVLAKTQEGVINGYSANELYYELPGRVFTGDNHTMMVLDYDFLGLSTMAQMPVFGLVGQDIFGRFVVALDMDKQIITLIEPQTFTPPSGYEALPLKLEAGKVKLGISTVHENWEKETSYFLIKSGAPHTIFFDSEQNLFNIPPLKVETTLGRGSTGDVMGYVGRVREILVGKSRFENAIASYTKEQIKGQDRSSIGMGLLSRFNLIFDFQGGTLYLKPNKSYSKLFEFDLSGIKISPTGDGRFFVDFVQPDSPAFHAGVREGYQLLAINGVELSDDNFGQMAATLNDKPDKKITLKLLQGDVQKEVSFKLIRFI